MNIYPYTSPIILNEAMYIEYGGQTGSATSAQLQNSFLIAEQRVSNYIGTFLLPTIVTGTFPHTKHQFVASDYGYVHRVLSADIISIDNLSTCSTREDDACTFISDDTFAYINYSCVCSQCNCKSLQYPYQFRMAYEAGLPTGTANQPAIEHALVIIASESLAEMSYPLAGETAGNRAVESWSSLDYSEKRKKWPTTALGASARSAYAAELIKSTIPLARRSITLR